MMYVCDIMTYSVLSHKDYCAAMVLSKVLIVTEAKSNGDMSSPDDNISELESNSKVSRTIPPKLQDRLKTRSIKNWNTSYVVLAKTNIIFYKDKKASTSQPGSPHGKPDFIVPLQDAQIAKISKDSSNKKTVVRVSTRTGDQYVLQNDDEKTLLIWFMQLELAVADLGSSGMESNLRVVRSTSQEDTKSEPKRKPSFKLFHSRNASTSSSPGDDGSLERRKRGDIWDKLSNFVARRPSKDVLEQKGIIKDAVFGAHLKQVCDKDKAKVPKFVTRAIEAIEKRGLDHDGMYRVSGNLATIQKIRCQIDQDNYNLDSEEWDIHALTGCLKLFFRELREPLFPFVYFDKFIPCPQSSDRLKAMKDLVSTLPKCNYETMKTLFIHLLKVIDQSKENRMQVHNIAIVFGPTLIWPEKETPNLAANMIYQSRIVEFLLLEFKHIFKS
ncbi:hypothetical protein KUTeg_008880 [Tegillarca granosa]|uniref:Rho GTPase-activating protein 15 n=1 Tax=Tegillarca granosa TaxID=220873 RepID=A0ABQ9FAC5_TEGGR|nr:hypothetical protein KUTeg_008880 [Tegillarca granosa]